MSEEKNTPEGGATEDKGGKEFTAITSQEALDKIISERLNRERSKFSDYDVLKEKAAKFDEVEQANKTELQKERERAEAAEARASAAEQQALKVRIAAEMNVPVEVLHGNDEASIRAAAQKVIEWRDSNKKAAPKASSLKSGASSDDAATGKERAALALRQLRGSA